MNNITDNSFERISFEKIDSLDISEAIEIIGHVESNTKWEDTSKHLTTNGSGMNC